MIKNNFENQAQPLNLFPIENKTVELTHIVTALAAM